jgi:hypothetical protein
MEREYRLYSDIKWGEHYNSETQAHHCFATGPDEAAEVLRKFRKKGEGFGSMQVRLGDKWQWVTETAHFHGGIKSSY